MSDRGNLRAYLDEAWGHLLRGVADKHAPARHPTLATVSPEGWPEARTVVLRAARRFAGVLEVHTDSRTAKMRALQAAPRAALHVWIPRAQLQIRAQTQVQILTGDTVEERWAKVPEGARVSYGTDPHPGTPIARVDAYNTPGARARFAVLCCEISTLDVLHLGASHRRAVFDRRDGFKGHWVAP